MDAEAAGAVRRPWEAAEAGAWMAGTLELAEGQKASKDSWATLHPILSPSMKSVVWAVMLVAELFPDFRHSRGGLHVRCASGSRSGRGDEVIRERLREKRALLSYHERQLRTLEDAQRSGRSGGSGGRIDPMIISLRSILSQIEREIADLERYQAAMGR